MKPPGNQPNLKYLPTPLSSELSGSSSHNFSTPLAWRRWFSAFKEMTDMLIHVCMFLYYSLSVTNVQQCSCIYFLLKEPVVLGGRGVQSFHVQLRKKCPIHPREHIISEKWMTLSSPLPYSHRIAKNSNTTKHLHIYQVFNISIFKNPLVCKYLFAVLQGF